MVKKIIILLTLGIILQSLHLLPQIEPKTKQLKQSFEKGDTSHAFSIAMQMYTIIQQLNKQLNIKKPVSSFSIIQHESFDCQKILQIVSQLIFQLNQTEKFEQLQKQLNLLQQKCTNINFVSLQSGFQNRCAICVVLLQIIENYVNYHRLQISDFLKHELCLLLQDTLKPTCQAFIHYLGPKIIPMLIKKQSSDIICLKIGYCNDPNCKLIKQKASFLDGQLKDQKPAPWQWIEHLFVTRFGNQHLSPFDWDNDTFSDISSFRGYNWKGHDCNQFNPKMYPGYKEGSKLIDQDCNGIFGVDLKGKSYEQKFCSEKNRYGVVVIGDSAGAHFSIPQKYFNVSMMHKNTFKDLLYRVANQLDLPQESGYTANINTTYQSHSIYKYLRKWNLCNHNDYQNIGVNGGDSGNTLDNIKALSRNHTTDYPLLMFMELIGNDVCKKSFESMRKPEDFKNNILKLLQWLDQKIPSGSHLIILGLADGKILYDNLYNETHPLNVTYSNVYDFLNCLKISPCWGWLNSNQTVRNFTTQRAINLSKMYQQIINEGTTFKNFDMVYYDFPTVQIMQRKIREGGSPKDLIQKCDGFHPNGQFHSYLADWLWNKLLTKHRQWIGDQNPFNDKIREIFGHSILQ